MAFTSTGYDGSVDEEPWVSFSPHIGGFYHVGNDVGALRTTAAGAGDRAVTVATGAAYGRGVYDVNDAPVVKNLSSVGSGSRWDMIVAHRDWSTNTTSIQVIEGGSTKALPTRSTGFPADDQPLSLVRVTAGSTAIAEIVDLRVWGMAGGILIARDILVLTYIDFIGAVVRIGDTEYTRNIDSAGTAYWAANIPNLVINDNPPTSADGINGDVRVEF